MTQTRRTFMKTAAASTGLLGLGSTTAGAEATTESITFAEDFDDLQVIWQVTQDLDDPFFSGLWGASLVSPPLAESNLVEFFVDGFATPGMVWIYAPIDVEPGTAYEGTAKLDLYSPVGATDNTRLHVCVGPELPAKRGEFPDEFEAWRLMGDRLGINVSLGDSAGWSEFSTSWASPALSTDTLYCAVGISTDDFATSIHYLDSLEITLTPEDTADEADIVEDVSLDLLDPDVDREIRFDEDTDTITVRDSLVAPTPCHELDVVTTDYEVESDNLSLELALEETGDMCAQVLEPIGYELTIDCTHLPSSVEVTAPGDEAISAVSQPELIDVKFQMGEEATAIQDELSGDDEGEWDRGVHYEPATNTVHIVDEVTGTDACEMPALESTTVIEERFLATVDLESHADYCAQVLTDVPIHIEATFENGLPGVVEYTAPDQY